MWAHEYGCLLEELEKRVERSVPVEKYEIWEDSIEWRNAEEETERSETLEVESNISGKNKA